MKITTKIIPIVLGVSTGERAFIASAAPVRVLNKEYNAIKEKPITSVFVAPTRIRKSFLFVFAIAFPITAACPVPKPGRKLHKGDANKEPIIGRKSFFFDIIIFWGGIFVLFSILKMIVDAPKSPLKSGRSGCEREFLGKFKTAIPKIPVIAKTMSALNFLFSFKIRIPDIIISKKGVIGFTKEYIFGRISIEGYAIRRRMIIAERLP